MHGMSKRTPFSFRRPHVNFKPAFKNPGLQKHELQVIPDTGSRMSIPVRAVQAFPLCQPLVSPFLKQILLNTNVFTSGLHSELK